MVGCEWMSGLQVQEGGEEDGQRAARARPLQIRPDLLAAVVGGGP